MIFQRAAQREFAHTAAGVFVALFAILITTQLIRLLGQATTGATAPEAVATLMGLGALSTLPVILSLTLFVSILLTLSRAYRDSEMAVWFCAGVPLTTWMRPVIRFALPMVSLIALLSLFLTPWAQNAQSDYRKRMDHRGDVARMSPGAFRESAKGERVFFVESVTDEQTNQDQVKNIFISATQHGRQGVVVASTGHTEMAENGDKFMVLSQGRRYETKAGSSEYRVMEFESYAVRMDTAEKLDVDSSPRSMTTLELLREPTPAMLAELLWRVGLPIAALMLALLAIPLSFVNPRAGRTSNLIFALLTFLIYNNLLSVSQAWVARGKLPFGIGIWAVHVVMLVVLVVAFWYRISVHSVWNRRK